MKSLWVSVPDPFSDQLLQLWFEHDLKRWFPWLGWVSQPFCCCSLSLFLEGRGFSWREWLSALCRAATGEGGKERDLHTAHSRQHFLHVTPWQSHSENRCVVWYEEYFSGKWESWILGQRRLESIYPIFLASTQPSDCCVIVWDGAGLFLLFWIQQLCINLCKIWKAEDGTSKEEFGPETCT